MAKPLKYDLKDFKVLKGARTGDKRIAYVFKSRDNVVEANLFWEPSNVEMRLIIWDNKTGNIIGQRGIAYPLVNYRGGGVLPKPDVFINSLIRVLARGDYEGV